MTYFLKAVKKSGLYERFSSLVKGFGYVCQYLSEKLPGLTKDFGDITQQILRSRASPFDWSDVKAQSLCHVVETIFENSGGPDFDNFFSQCCHPLTSTYIQLLIDRKTWDEKLRNCLALQHFLTDEIAASQVEVVLEGLYLPTTSNIAMSSKPVQAANGMVRLLVEADLDFERLHEIYNTKGLTELELSLRSAFLNKMSGQPRSVVDQFITTSRMIVKYFKTHGHLPLKEILASATQTAKKMSDDEFNYRGKKLEDTPQMQQINLLKELLKYVQKKLLYQSLNSQDVDKLLKIFITSDLTMDTIEALILKSCCSKLEFCQNVENTLAEYWNLPRVSISEVS